MLSAGSRCRVFHAPASKARLIVIDECSMVDAELGRDLLSFGTPLLVLGDPAQLPPIQGAGFFTAGEPDAMLTEVHRQARNDPIVRLSMEVRSGNRLAPGKYGLTEVVARADFDPQRKLAPVCSSALARTRAPPRGKQRAPNSMNSSSRGSCTS